MVVAIRPIQPFEDVRHVVCEETVEARRMSGRCPQWTRSATCDTISRKNLLGGEICGGPWCAGGSFAWIGHPRPEPGATRRRLSHASRSVSWYRIVRYP